MANSGGKSALGAVGASGLTRVGMRAGRAIASEALDRHDYRHDGKMRFLEAWDTAYGERASGWLDENPSASIRVPSGHALARRRSQYEGLSVAVPDITFHRYDDQRQLAQFDVLRVGPDVKSVAAGDTVLALSFAGKRLAALGPGLVLLRCPEVECHASEEMLSSDIVWQKDVRDETTILERFEDGRCRVRRAANRHRTSLGRADGCVCGGEIAAILETSNSQTDPAGNRGD